MKKALFYIVSGISIAIFNVVLPACSPMIREHFRESIQKLDNNLSSSEQYELKKYLQNHISEIGRNEYYLIGFLNRDLKEYKEQTAAKKEKILSSLRYALLKKLPTMKKETVDACMDGAFATSFASYIGLLGALIAEGFSNRKIISQNMLETIMTLVGCSTGLVGGCLINELIVTIKEGYQETFDTIDAKIEIIDQLTRCLDQRKAAIDNWW